jgi:hypothetical protein
MTEKIISLLIAFTILQGCSGGGSKTTAELLDTYSYTQMQTKGLDVYANNHFENESFVSTLPKGSMQYNGVAFFTDAAPNIIAAVEGKAGGSANVDSSFISGGSTIPNAIGHMQVNANFVKGIATGQITNIEKVATKTASGAYKTGYEMEGEIRIKNGVITSNELEASFVGNLDDEGTPQIYEGTLKGLFIGQNGEGLYGDFDSGTIANGAPLSLKGGFLTEATQ